MLTIDKYLAAESFVKDGLFVFENGASLIGKDTAGLAAQLTRYDPEHDKQNAFIPPTAFDDVNKVRFDFAEDGQVTTLHLRLTFVDDGHRDRLLAGLVAGLGAATKDGAMLRHTNAGRVVAVKVRKDKLEVTVTTADAP